MANLFGNVPAPKFPDPWEISAQGNREMLQSFTSAFTTAQRINAQRQERREDPLTALKRDQAVNNLALTALEIKAAQIRNDMDVEKINERARGLREIESFTKTAGQDYSAFDKPSPSANPVFNQWYEKQQMEKNRMDVLKARQQNARTVNTIYHELTKAANAEEAAALAAIPLDENGNVPPEYGATLITLRGGQNTRLAKEKEGEGGKNYKVSYEEIGGRPSALIYVPGSKQAPKVMDLSVLSPTDMVQFRAAIRRRDMAQSDMLDPIKSRNAAKFQQIVDEADAEIQSLLSKSPSVQTPAPAATPTPPATETPSAAAPADEWKPFGQFKFRVVQP